MNLEATDTSTISAWGGGVAMGVGASEKGIGGALAVGLSLAWNDIVNEIRAYVDESSVLAAGNVTLTATSTATVYALTIGGSLAVGGPLAKGRTGRSGFRRGFRQCDQEHD